MAISRLRNVYIYIDCFFKFCIIVMSMRTFFLFFVFQIIIFFKVNCIANSGHLQ